MRRRLSAAVAWALLTVLAGAAPAQAAKKQYCGELANAFGPFDYRKPEHAGELGIVEQAHFTEDVENGVKGNTGSVGADLDYTLRAFPNHPRALEAVRRITLREKLVQLPGAHYPSECYFERAARFAPDDGAPRAVYASYLHAQGQYDREREMLVQAAGLAPDNAAIHYNLGLAYARHKDYDKALDQAHQAYALDFPLAGLRQMLSAAGQWRDPVAPARPRPDAAAPAEPGAAAAADAGSGPR